MNSQPVFAATAFVLTSFGASFLLIPTWLFPFYGVALDASSLVLARVAGAAVLALGFLAWRNHRNPVGDQRAVHQTLALFFLVKAVVTLMALLVGVFNVWGWTILALDIPLFAMNAGRSFGDERSAPRP